MADQAPPEEDIAPRQSVLMRKFSRVLDRTATFTEEVTETISFLTDVNGGVEAALQEADEKEAEAQIEATLEPKLTETASQAGKRYEMTEKMGEGFLHPESIMFRDKVVFFVGVVNVVLIALWIGASPGTYYHFWTFKCATLFPLRWWSYKKRGWHYLMLELCYFGNLVGIAHVYFFPYSILLRKLTFAFGAGPLMWSILAMRNSLVFHDFEKTTTLMMHASPAITAWTLRWHPSPAWSAALTPAQGADFNISSWSELFFLPVAFYFIWVVLYYVITFVVLHNRIVGRGRATMFSLMVPKDPEAARKSPLARMVMKAPENIQPVVYLGCHGIAASLSFLPVKIFYDHYWLHTAGLVYCLGLSIWNGGNYYFKVFAKKYLAQLQQEAEAAAKAKLAAKSKAN